MQTIYRKMAQKKRKARALAASGHLRVCVGVGVRVCFWPVADAARLAVCSGPRWVLLAAGSLGRRVGCLFDAGMSSTRRFAAGRWGLLYCVCFGPTRPVAVCSWPQWILLTAGSLDPRVGCFFDAATSSILRFAAERWELLSFCSRFFVEACWPVSVG